MAKQHPARQTVIDPANFTWSDLGRTLWYFVGAIRGQYLFLLFFLTTIYFYDFVPPWVVGKIIDVLRQGAGPIQVQTAYQLAIFAGGSFILVAYIRQWIKNQLGKIAIDVQYRARVEGFARLMEYSLTWHQTESTGNRMQKITNGVAHLRSMMTLISRDILSHIVIIVGALIIFMTFGGAFVPFALVFGVLFLGNEWYFYRKNRVANDAYNKALEQSSGAYFESASNVLTIKSLGVKDSAQARVVSSEALARKHAIEIRDLTTKKWSTFQTINGLSLLVLLSLVIPRVATGMMTTGTVLILFSYLTRLTKSAGDTGEILVDAIEHSSAISRMMPIFWDKLVVRTGSKVFPTKWQQLEIKSGNFHYQGAHDRFQLSNINFLVKRNEKVGIVGASGSGKSTLAKLLLGLYDLDAGSFTIGGINYYDIRHDDLRHHISTVLQETELFNLSLRENLSLFRSVSPELLAQAIEIAQLEPVIRKLPQGVETLIGEKGYRLSGGERQRVGIARAICSDAEILIFDEATAALDSKTEELIQQRLEAELQKKTMLIIAHRLSTLKTVDRILVFEQGKIIEEGTFAELLADQSTRFAQMYELQAKQTKKRTNSNTKQTTKFVMETSPSPANS